LQQVAHTAHQLECKLTIMQVAFTRIPLTSCHMNCQCAPGAQLDYPNWTTRLGYYYTLIGNWYLVIGS